MSGPVMMTRERHLQRIESHRALLGDAAIARAIVKCEYDLMRFRGGAARFAPYRRALISHLYFGGALWSWRLGQVVAQVRGAVDDPAKGDREPGVIATLAGGSCDLRVVRLVEWVRKQVRQLFGPSPLPALDQLLGLHRKQNFDRIAQGVDFGLVAVVHRLVSKAGLDNPIGAGVAAGGNVGGDVCSPDLNGEAAQPEAAE